MANFVEYSNTVIPILTNAMSQRLKEKSRWRSKFVKL